MTQSKGCSNKWMNSKGSGWGDAPLLRMKHSIHSRLTERQTGSSFTPGDTWQTHIRTKRHINVHKEVLLQKHFIIFDRFWVICSFHWRALLFVFKLTCRGWGLQCSWASNHGSRGTSWERDRLLLLEGPSGRSRRSRYSWSGKRSVAFEVNMHALSPYFTPFLSGLLQLHECICVQIQCLTAIRFQNCVTLAS